MTDLESILLAMLWAIYGIYHGYKWSLGDQAIDGVAEYIISVLFAPICLFARAIRGILWV